MGRTAPSVMGLRNLLECQDAAAEPVSASPSPTMQADDEVGIVECCAIGVKERVAELTTLMDGAGNIRGVVRGDAVGPRELAEEALEAVVIALDAGVDLGVGAFEVGVGYDAGSAMPGADDEHHVGVLVPDDAVEVEVDEVEARGGAEVAEQARLDVVAGERATEQRVFLQVDLADGEIVGGAPVGVHEIELVLVEMEMSQDARRPLLCDCGRWTWLWRRSAWNLLAAGECGGATRVLGIGCGSSERIQFSRHQPYYANIKTGR